jgi:hypothetical protein
MRTWRRRQREADPGPVLERTLDDDAVHAIALGVAIACADGNEAAVRAILTGLNAADLTEITGDVGALAVSAFRVNGHAPERARDAFQWLAFRQASQ